MKDICAVTGESAMFYCYMIRITWVARCTERAKRAVTLREKKSSYHLHIALLLYEHCNGTLRLKSNKNIKRGRQPSITVGDFLGRPRNSPLGFRHSCPATRPWTSILPTSMLCDQLRSVIFSRCRSLLFTEWVMEIFFFFFELFSSFTLQNTACWNSFCEIVALEEEKSENYRLWNTAKTKGKKMECEGSKALEVAILWCRIPRSTALVMPTHWSHWFPLGAP